MHYDLRVVGNPIAHSKSPILHQEFAKQAGLSITYEKVLASMEPDGFAKAIQQFINEGVVGCNVTLPFKELAYGLATTCSPRAARAKAANTYLFKPGNEIYADNTDGIGLIHDIQNNLGYQLKDKRILICGAGGAVRGILFSIIEQQPLTITIVNRSQEKALNIAAEFADMMPIQAFSYHDLVNQEFDVIIDGTSFSPEALPLSVSLRLSANSLCYDLKYNNNHLDDTLFMAWAKSRGARKVSDGLGMLVEQAAESFSLWTGFKPNTQLLIPFL